MPLSVILLNKKYILPVSINPKESTNSIPPDLQRNGVKLFQFVEFKKVKVCLTSQKVRGF
jgi:hypothetical protein